MSLKSVALAFQFLTVIPLHVKGEVTDQDVAASSQAFPLVGTFQGLFLSLTSLMFLLFLSPGITAGLVLLVYVLTNGGFHLDGLSDTFDALSVKSTGDKEKDREKRLAVMKDSSTGAIGTVAIWFALTLKHICMREILLSGNELYACFIFFMMPLFSAWAMAAVMYRGKSARKDGLGRVFLERIRLRHIMVSTLITLAFSLVPFFVFRMFQHAWEPALVVFCLGAMVIVYLSALFIKKTCTKKFGGITGDNFGAVHEITEIIFLVAALLWG